MNPILSRWGITPDAWFCLQAVLGGVTVPQQCTRPCSVRSVGVFGEISSLGGILGLQRWCSAGLRLNLSVG